MTLMTLTNPKEIVQTGSKHKISNYAFFNKEDVLKGELCWEKSVS